MGIFDKLQKKNKGSVEPTVLVESDSPLCDIHAFVEQDENTIYFYLYLFAHTEQPKVKPCFVCNVKGKESAISYQDWLNSKQSKPPMMPYEYVTHSVEGMTLEEELLEIVWTLEGSGAGLFYKDELIAFIPEWANENCNGFSRYVIGHELSLAWELTEAEDNFNAQMAAARAFWGKVFGGYWHDFQKAHLNAIEDYIGKTDKYYAIDGGNWPPMALTTGEKDGVLYGITLGVSAFRQPWVESFYQENTKDFARMEVGFACQKQMEPIFMTVLKAISGGAAMPWRKITSLGHGHTLKLNDGGEFAALLFLNANLLQGSCTPKYSDSFGERVNLLWAVPITAEDYEFLLQFDMPKIFNLTFDENIYIFDGRSKCFKEMLQD